MEVSQMREGQDSHDDHYGYGHEDRLACGSF